jgi:hypothetical protein
MKKDIPMAKLDPARTVLVPVHMRWIPPSTAFSGTELRRKGSSRPSYGCWTGSAGPRRRWSTLRSHTSQGSPGSVRILRCGLPSSTVPA